MSEPAGRRHKGENRGKYWAKKHSIYLPSRNKNDQGKETAQFPRIALGPIVYGAVKAIGILFYWYGNVLIYCIILEFKGAAMGRKFTLEYWIDDEWYVGKLKEVPGVFSEGVSLQELEENIADAYRMMIFEQEECEPSLEIKSKELSFRV